MTLERALLLFAFAVFTVVSFSLLRWLLNQPSDYLLLLAGLVFILYVWVTVKSRAFTKNPFKS